MKKRTLLSHLYLASLMLILGNAAWAACNSNSVETGAGTVIDLQGQGNFTCAQISGSQENCLNGGCTMVPVPGFTYKVDNVGGRNVVTWKAPVQVDKIFVTASGNGSRCLYDFSPGGTSTTLDVNSPPPGSYLEPAGNLNQTTVVACYDGVEVETPPPPQVPIATVTNCAAALPGVQSAIENDPNVVTAIIIGTDEGLSGEGNGDPSTVGDGDYVLGVCGNDGQIQCVDQCRQPTDATYVCNAGPGEECLNERACATSDELPTEVDGAPRYCWELSHQVDIARGAFTTPTEKESGAAFWEQYEGSTCVKVTTSYRGTTYSYWSPAGCP